MTCDTIQACQTNEAILHDRMIILQSIILSLSVCVCVLQTNKFSHFRNMIHSLLLRIERFFKVFPQDGKENPLESVTENLGLESSQKESLHARFRNNVADHLKVGQSIGMALFVDLDDPNGIGTRVTDGRRTKSNESATTQFLDAIVLLREAFR